MDVRQENRSNGKSELFLIDGSALQIHNLNRIPCWTTYRNSSSSKLIVEDMNYIGSFLRFAKDVNIITIDEVIIERERLEEILREHIAGCKTSLKDTKNKVHRTNSRCSGELSDVLKSGELFLSDLDRYGKKVRKCVNCLKKEVFNPEEMDEFSREIYGGALYEAGLEHKTSEDKFGDKLETDIKLIATASVLALKNPVIVVSRDMSLLRSLEVVLKTVLGNDGSVSPHYVGSYISPRNSNGSFYYPNVVVRLHNPK